MPPGIADRIELRRSTPGSRQSATICTSSAVHARWLRHPKRKQPAIQTPMQQFRADDDAEATVAALVAHGIRHIYALPGVHNDALFDAMFAAGDRLRTVHTRHEQAAAYMALGAALCDRRAQAYAVVPGRDCLIRRRRCSPPMDERAGTGLDRPISQAAIGRGLGHFMKSAIRPDHPTGRFLDRTADLTRPPNLVAAGLRAMDSGRRGPERARMRD